jgi:hypothetical protein
MREAEGVYLDHPVTLTAGEAGLVLSSVSLTPPGKTPALTLSGVATTTGVTLHFAGSATEAQMVGLRALAPPVGDGLMEVIRPDGAAVKGEAARVMKVDATCTRVWGGGQSCVESAPVVKRRR